MSQINPLCPSGCSTLVPSVDFDVCSPSIYFGEVEHLYIASGDAEPFTDFESLAEWTARLSQDGQDANAIRDFHVMADLPAASADEVLLSLGRKAYSPATHTLNVDIDDVSDLNYEFARTTSCNSLYRVWFANRSHIWGGNEGILANINLRPVIERGQKSINRLSGTVVWENKFSPERGTNPFAS